MEYKNPYLGNGLSRLWNNKNIKLVEDFLRKNNMGYKYKVFAKKYEQKELYIVHCVDSEGPLYEDLNATFQRVEKLGVNLNNYKRNEKTLTLLQKQKYL